MLVLSRRVGEELVIDGKVRVVVLQSRGGQVRLGIHAPREIPVFRKELIGCRDEGASGNQQRQVAEGRSSRA